MIFDIYNSERAKQEGEECIEQPARGVQSTMGEAVQFFTQEDLEDIAGLAISEGGKFVEQIAVEVMIVRCTQSTMRTYMVGGMDEWKSGTPPEM